MTYSALVNLYATHVLAGVRKLEQVPETLRSQVQSVLFKD